MVPSPMSPQRTTIRAVLPRRIKILENKLHNTPAGFSLLPGMPLTGDVNIGKRTIAEYMMKRVLPAFTEGMREPN